MALDWLLEDRPSYVSLPANTPYTQWVNSDTYLAYWDIVRNYYCYSQWSLYSFAWPASWYLFSNSDSVSGPDRNLGYNSDSSFFTQRYGNLEYLDAFFESQFYPSSVTSSNEAYNRFNLFYQIIRSDIGGAGSSGELS